MLLKGAEVSKALMAETANRVLALKEAGCAPMMAIVRVGERDDDLAYERSILSRAEKAGILTRQYVLPETAVTEDVLAIVREINEDPAIHGALLFIPMPKGIDEKKVRRTLHPQKDLDGICPLSQYGVFADAPMGYPPCTPDACMRILDYYGIDVTGKRAVVVGRSLVVGKPLSMMLLKKNATVTICHTRTKDTAAECRAADIVVAAAGKKCILGAECFAPGQIVLDVGIHEDEDGKLCGDVDTEAAAAIVDSITPVPGGVGSVTTAVLLSHLADAAEKAMAK